MMRYFNPLTSQFEIKLTLDLIIGDFKTKDEFSYFKEAYTKLCAEGGEQFAKMIEQMPVKAKRLLKNVKQSKRITITQKGNQVRVIRKLVKGRRRIPAANAAPGTATTTSTTPSQEF